MSLWQNIPSFSILFSMIAAIITSAVKGKTARKISIGLSTLNIVFSLVLLVFLYESKTSFVYMMGHFPAPWGNEIRAGMLEATVALLFSFVTLTGLLGGSEELRDDLEKDKAHFYYIMVDLMLAANLALVYTNDMFNAYVFVEINTMAACGLILGRFRGRNIASAIHYMIMSMVGSGLLLLGICFMYDITVPLLMSNMKEMLAALPDTYHVPFMITIGLMVAGLAIKSALWPFHSWLPNAYGTSTPASQAMLSSIISKGYIMLLFKLVFRVWGFENFNLSHAGLILLVFGCIGMIRGSVDAFRHPNLKRMIAYSSVAQIGYIYMGLGMGNELGVSGSLYHILAHASAKSLAFISIAGLIRANNGESNINKMRATAHRNPIAGFGFMVASCSMIGIPGFAGFVSKLLLAKASFASLPLAILVLGCLTVSTLLNTVYFMRVALVIYQPLSVAGEQLEKTRVRNDRCYTAAILMAVAFNLMLGIGAKPFVEIVTTGLSIFG